MADVIANMADGIATARWLKTQIKIKLTPVAIPSATLVITSTNTLTFSSDPRKPCWKTGKSLSPNSKIVFLRNIIVVKRTMTKIFCSFQLNFIIKWVCKIDWVVKIS